MKQTEPTEAGLAIIEIVENQLKLNKPPEVGRTLDRLMNNGEDRENAIKYIANALLIETLDIMKNHATFNEDRYIRNLKGLPDLSFLDDEI